MTEKRVKCHSFLRTLRFWREMLRFSSRNLPAWRGLGFCFVFCFIFCFFRPTPRSPATGGQGNVRQRRSERLAKTAWPLPKAGEKEAAGLPSAVGRWAVPSHKAFGLEKLARFLRYAARPRLARTYFPITSQPKYFFSTSGTFTVPSAF